MQRLQWQMRTLPEVAETWHHTANNVAPLNIEAAADARRLQKDPQHPMPTAKFCRVSDDGVGVITFNKPEKRNAMSVEMWEGLGHILDELRDDPAVRVVMLAGAGDKAFVSGADISQFEKKRAQCRGRSRNIRPAQRGAARSCSRSYPKPTIACIRGFCLGGGMAGRDADRYPHRRRRTASSAFPPPSSASPMAMTASSIWSRWSGRPGRG